MYHELKYTNRIVGFDAKLERDMFMIGIPEICHLIVSLQMWRTQHDLHCDASSHRCYTRQLMYALGSAMTLLSVQAGRQGQLSVSALNMLKSYIDALQHELEEADKHWNAF